MKVYYVRDSFGYRVEYYYENVLDESKTETGTALFNDRITTYNDKVETGYELDKTEGLPLTIGTNANNNVIKVYYKLRVCDYSIDYYYDGTKDSNETINATAKYGSQINTYENKIRDGYKLQKTENLPLTVGLNASENVINVYYVKDNFGYTIEYYYDGENDPEKTETGTAEFESRISSYPDKNITGYKLDKTENFPLTITSDPQNNLIKVYYVKDSFGYSIEYYYDETKDDSKTVTGTAEFGSQITEYEDKVIDGYKFDKVENKPLTITNTATSNVMKVYYVKDSFGYSIEYYYDGTKDDSKTITGTAEFASQITEYEDKVIDGYKFDKVENKPLTITNIATSNVMKVYYVKDSFGYSIEYYYENVKDDQKTETGTAEFDSQITNYTDKNIEGYKLDKTENLPLTIKSDPTKNIIKIYYIIDDGNTKKLEYFVEYYKDNVLVSSDTDHETLEVQILEPNDIPVLKDKINTTNKYDGYKFDHTDPSTIPDAIYTGSTIKVYYVKDNFAYSIEYYYDGTKDDSKTETGTALFESQITSYTDKIIEGYKLDKVENKPLTITSNKDDNIMKVYYVKDTFQYKVEYYYENVKDDSKTETGYAIFRDVITNYTDKLETGYELDKTENLPLTITSTSANNVIKVYYKLKVCAYTINYYYDDVKDDSKTVTDSAKYGTKIETYTEQLKDGYKFSHDENVPLIIGLEENNNVINVYYVRDNFAYTIEYYYENVKDDSKTESGTALFNSVIDTYTDNLIKGYRLDKEENYPLTITSNKDNNVMKIYYVIDETQTDDIAYTVEYYKDNVIVSSDTQTVGKTVQVLDDHILDVIKEDINLIDKYVGYSYDHFEIITPSTKRMLKATKAPETLPDTVVDGTVIRVYYVINEYDYDVEYYLQDTDGNYQPNSEAGYTEEGVTYGTKTKFENKTFEHYTLNENKTENNDIEVTEDGIVVKVYYDLDKANIIVHYVVSDVDDGHYTLFSEFGVDDEGNVIEPFVGLDLEDADLDGYIGAKTTLKGRKPVEYNFLGVYLNDELVSESEDFEVEFEEETKEYIYVYQAPAGDIPPHTGIDDEVNNSSIFGIISIITVMSSGMYFLRREEN